MNIKPENELWDQYGTPKRPNTPIPCPKCGEWGEVGSYFDSAWCCYCGWHGSLTSLHTTFTPVTPAGSGDALQTQEETSAGSEGLLRDVRQSEEARRSAQPTHQDTKGTGGSAVGEGADR